MPKAVIIQETGGAEVLKAVNIAAPKTVKPGELIIKQKFVAVNHTDIHYRRGEFKVPSLPFILGSEATGVIAAVGKGVMAAIGTRVAYCTAASGAYTQLRAINHNQVVVIPKEIPDEIAAAVLSKGMAAHYLLRRTLFVKKGDVVLVNGAAGALGQILCQWASFIGAVVIGTVGSEAKIMTARSCGCHHVFTTAQDFVSEVKKITGNRGVNIVYDMVGKDTFQRSLNCLMPLGLMVCVGQASGAIPAINVFALASRGLFLTKPTLNLYKSDRMELLLTAIEVFKMIIDKDLKVNIAKKYKLEDAEQAHRDIESRKIVGSVILEV